MTWDARLGRISLQGLRAKGRHGVHDHERREGQTFVVDLVLHLETATAAASDDLADTVDYAVLSREVAALVGGEPVDLLETLAERIAAHCLDKPPVRRVDVTVHKPDLRLPVEVSDVAVSVTRERL